MTACVLGIGSNQGDTRHHVAGAVHEIQSWQQARLVAVSSWRETAPVGGPRQQPAFLNGAVLLETEEPPLSVLDQLLQIECRLGRQRGPRWGPRTVDLDLLLYGRSMVSLPRLVVPHPWMTVRHFVAQPAAEVAPDMVHPQIGWTLQQLWDHLRDTRPLIAVAGIQSAQQRAIVRTVATRSAAHLVAHPEPNDTSVLTRPQAVELAMRLKRRAAQGWAEAVENEIVLCDFWWEEPLATDGWTVNDPVTSPVEIVVVLNHDLPVVRKSPTPLHLLPRAARWGRGPYVQIPSANPIRLEHDLTAVINGLR